MIVETKKVTDCNDNVTITETTTVEDINSVELKTDTKGKIAPVVKVYNADVEKAAEIALKIMETLRVSLGDRIAG